MKNILMTTLVVLATSFTFAGIPPEKIKIAFEKKFPNANKIKWGKEGKTEWEAEFKMNEISCSANFAIDGSWLETETEIKVSELPEVVSKAILSKYPTAKITSADKIESAKKPTVYEADLKIGRKEKEVLVHSDGTFSK